eukprot:Skav231282  [mRNA]  locus=scaffold161:99605:102294:+ [translate_table: standard]
MLSRQLCKRFMDVSWSQERAKMLSPEEEDEAARQQILSADEALERVKRSTMAAAARHLYYRSLSIGNAEVERAQQAARQAELLASEAKKGEVEEKHKTSEHPARLTEWSE